MKTQVRKWLYGLLGGTIGGAATAVLSWGGLAGAHAVGVNVPTLNVKAFGIVLISGALASAFSYLKQSPLPPEEAFEEEVQNVPEPAGK